MWIRSKDTSKEKYLLLIGNFFIEQVDKINPQTAARLASAFSTFRRYDAGRQSLIRAQLQRLLDAPAISKFTFEIASRSLKE